jgi:hypothetical protein
MIAHVAGLPLEELLLPASGTALLTGRVLLMRVRRWRR